MARRTWLAVITIATAAGCYGPTEPSPNALDPTGQPPLTSLSEVLEPDPPDEPRLYNRDGRLGEDPDDNDGRNTDGAEGNLNGRIAGPQYFDDPVPGADAGIPDPGMMGGADGGGAHELAPRRDDWLLGSGGGVAWTCPPNITASRSCAADFQRGTAFCDASGRVTAAGVARVRTCNSYPSGSAECGYYLSLRQCQGDCSACQSNRLVGYYQTCRNMSQIAQGDLANAPRTYGFCQNLCEYQGYVSGMRRCLQNQADALQRLWNRDYPGTALSCSGVVGGPVDARTGRRDLNAGVIGSHTFCNEAQGFCGLSNPSRQCFGAGLGNSWAGMCLGPGGHSPWGSWQSVGMCHMFAQAASCGARGSLANFVDSLCQGYQDGCMTAPGCAYMPKRLACMLACPRSQDIATIRRILWAPISLIPGVRSEDVRLVRQFMDLLSRVFQGDVSNVAAMESVCESIIGRDIAPGISCENPRPPPTNCCCRLPSGPAVSYTSPQACVANNSRPGFNVLSVDWATCNRRGWTVADCNGAPRQGETPDPEANRNCYSSTTGRIMPTGACLQSSIDRLWYQCGPIGWVRAPQLPAATAGPLGACVSRTAAP